MPRFLIETTHGNEHDECVRALDAITRHGSHLVAQLDWGCDDGVHCGWIVVDVDDRNEALRLAPPQYRASARIVALSRWSRDQIEEMVRSLDS